MSDRTKASRLPLLKLDGKLAERHRVRAMGDGDAVIVFSHGLGTDRNAWLPVANQFTAEFLTIFFDWPGIGPHLPEGFDPDDFPSLLPYARSLLTLLQELGVPRCTYVAHSASCMIGALAAAEAPQFFEQLIFLNGSPRYLNDAGYYGGFELTDIEDLLDAMRSDYAGWVTGFAPLAIATRSGEALNQFANGLMAMRPQIVIQIAEMIYRSDYRYILDKVKTPTTIIQSRRDIAVPIEVARYLQYQIKRSWLIEIDSAGHLPHLSDPIGVAKALRLSLDLQERPH